MKRVLFIFGTRPEAIKLAPLIRAFQRQGCRYKVGVCVTSQHREMLDQVLDLFNIRPDYDLKLMRPNQSLSSLTSLGINKLERVIAAFAPDLVVVQGDTTTAFLGALAAYYGKIKVAHVEAGLRSNNKFSPYPEEINRSLVGRLADYHFAPTLLAKKNLASEGIKKNVWVVGNTVVDALMLGRDLIRADNSKYIKYFNFLNFSKKIIIVTGHRRENFGKPLKNICLALKTIAETHRDVEIVYPVHLNPNVKEPVFQSVGQVNNIHLLPPLPYSHFLWLLAKSYLVLTDSGGVQEEAPSLGVPAVVMRDVTERLEGVRSGNAVLSGTAASSIIAHANRILGSRKVFQKMAEAKNPYGDGHASTRIFRCIKKMMPAGSRDRTPNLKFLAAESK